MRLVFNQWTKQGQKVDNTELTMGDFHCGTIFNCDLDLSEEQKQELQDALDKGYEPSWVMIP